MLIKCAANHKQSEQAVGSTARSDKRDSPGENSRTPRLGARVFRIRTRGLFTCAYRTWNPAPKTTTKTGGTNKQQSGGTKCNSDQIASKNKKGKSNGEIQARSRLQPGATKGSLSLDGREQTRIGGGNDDERAGWAVGFWWGCLFIAKAHRRRPSDRSHPSVCHDLAQPPGAVSQPVYSGRATARGRGILLGPYVHDTSAAQRSSSCVRSGSGRASHYSHLKLRCWIAHAQLARKKSEGTWTFSLEGKICSWNCSRKRLSGHSNF